LPDCDSFDVTLFWGVTAEGGASSLFIFAMSTIAPKMTAKLISAKAPPITEPAFGIMLTAQIALSKNNAEEPSTTSARAIVAKVFMAA
jgi:hypothetical protein